MKGLIKLILAALLAAALPAMARSDALPQQDTVARLPASPALWTVHGRGGSMAYLFGSVHLIPEAMDWQSARVTRAMQRADTFVFEVKLNDDTEHAVAAYIKNNGTLAPGMSLRSMLSPAARQDYDAALTLTGMRLEDVDSMRPWYASVTLDMADMMRRNYSAGGVDKQIFAWAVRQDKNIRSLETVPQQLAMLAPSGPKMEMETFEIELKNLQHASDTVGPLVDAWAQGDMAAMDRIASADLVKYPHVQKAMFTERNASWAQKIKLMLLEKPRIYFVVVGASHLSGPRGVPALLRKAGFEVDGP